MAIYSLCVRKDKRIVTCRHCSVKAKKSVFAIISIYSDTLGGMLLHLQIRNIHILTSLKKIKFRRLTLTHTLYRASLPPSSLTFPPKWSTFLNCLKYSIELIYLERYVRYFSHSIYLLKTLILPDVHLKWQEKNRQIILTVTSIRNWNIIIIFIGISLLLYWWRCNNNIVQHVLLVH